MEWGASSDAPESCWVAVRGSPYGLVRPAPTLPSFRLTLALAAESARAPGNKVIFSSYPGTIFSCDDFYILGSGLVSHLLCYHSPPPGSFSPGSLGAAGGQSPPPTPG